MEGMTTDQHPAGEQNVGGAPEARMSAIGLTLASPLYRGATVAMFLSGLGFSAAAPQIASYLVNVLGASLTAAGLFYLTNLTAPVAGYLIGVRSDRNRPTSGAVPDLCCRRVRGLGRDRVLTTVVDAVRGERPGTRRGRRRHLSAVRRSPR